MASLANSAAVLPRDAWMDIDSITRRVLRDDEGEVYMRDLMALARPINIGKLVSMTRVASDSANPVIRSMSGQTPVPMDKVVYTYRGTPVPIFQDGYGREWREWNTLQSENFDALADDEEAANAKIRKDQADYVLNGDTSIVFQGYSGTGIRSNPLAKTINIGASGANIDLTSPSTTSDAIDTFFTQTFGAMLDANLITGKVNIYISPEIGRNLDRSYSGANGFKGGSLLQYLLTNRRIGKIEVTFKLSGNEFFGFVPSAEFIRPLIGMAVNTTAMPRLYPTANYQFLKMGAMGLEIRADYNGKSGVFYSTNT
ncbi:major capsid protein [Sinorhizobium medicae]|nr:major capsid protein [Sinorhizobium medicae]